MRRVLCGLLAVALSMVGCAHSYSAKRGQNTVLVGSVSVFKSLELIGDTVSSDVRVHADENGNAIVTAGNGTVETVAVVLPPEGTEEFTGYLRKMQEWGLTAKKEGVEISKPVGFVLSSGMVDGSNITADFQSYKGGQYWAGILRFGYYNAFAAAGAPPGSSAGTKNVTTVLPPSSVESLLALLLDVGRHKEAAVKAKDKSALFK